MPFKGLTQFLMLRLYREVPILLTPAAKFRQGSTEAILGRFTLYRPFVPAGLRPKMSEA
jgi:hypothetical protein